MVGIFSRISGHRMSAQQRPHSSQEDKERTAPDGEMVVLVPSLNGVRAMQLGVEFKPIDHPTEPRDNDQPVKCPMPEPSILNDGTDMERAVRRGNAEEDRHSRDEGRHDNHRASNAGSTQEASNQPP